MRTLIQRKVRRLGNVVYAYMVLLICLRPAKITALKKE